ncbi:UNVERIFIED_CONTAM: hypothetical protein K2H54_055882, partial [Gekko kuhli]
VGAPPSPVVARREEAQKSPGLQRREIVHSQSPTGLTSIGTSAPSTCRPLPCLPPVVGTIHPLSRGQPLFLSGRLSLGILARFLGLLQIWRGGLLEVVSKPG